MHETLHSNSSCTRIVEPYLLRPLQVLNADGAHHRMETAILELELLVTVEVLDEEIVKPGVPGQLLGVEPVADHSLVRYLLRQVAHPGAHEVQHRPLRRQALPVEPRQSGDEGGVDVGHEAGEGVEVPVGGGVELGPAFAGEDEALDLNPGPGRVGVGRGHGSDSGKGGRRAHGDHGFIPSSAPREFAALKRRAGRASQMLSTEGLNSGRDVTQLTPHMP